MKPMSNAWPYVEKYYDDLVIRILNYLVDKNGSKFWEEFTIDSSLFMVVAENVRKLTKIFRELCDNDILISFELPTSHPATITFEFKKGAFVRLTNVLLLADAALDPNNYLHNYARRRLKQ